MRIFHFNFFYVTEVKSRPNINTGTRNKIYYKYMYKSQEKIKNIVLIIAVFIIGFIAGYASEINTISKLNKEINNLQENNSSTQN